MNIKSKMKAALVTASIVTSLLAFTPATIVQAEDLSFEPGVNIGTKGDGEGQILSVENFAHTIDGRVLTTDASHTKFQIFHKEGNFLTMFGASGSGKTQFGTL